MFYSRKPPTLVCILTVSILLGARAQASSFFVSQQAPGGDIPDPGTITSDLVFNYGPGVTVHPSAAPGSSVIVSLLGFQHPWAGDLVVTLTYIPQTGPTISADLFNRPGLGPTASSDCRQVNPQGFCANFGGNDTNGGNYTFDPTSPNDLWATVLNGNGGTGLGDQDGIPDCATMAPCGPNAIGTYFPTTANVNSPFYSPSDFSVFSGVDIGGNNTWRLTVSDNAAGPGTDPFPTFIGWQLDLFVDSPEPSYTVIFGLLGTAFLVIRRRRQQRG